mmetsp:Transcript_10708/g.35229  ORF Transcript_10708/g.35229 Transcript_10708/m.35229 type:complete len:235 (+) Transcript_10708:67-771(+)
MDSLPLTTAQQPAQGGAKRFVGFGLTLCAGALLGAAVSRSAAPAQQKSDTSHAGVTPIPSLGGALEQIPTGIGSDLNEGFKANPFYFDPHLRDHVKLSVTPSNTGCGEGGKQLIKPFYINSAKGDAKTFQWCVDGTCHLSLEMGGDTLHNDVGFLKLRGCPLHEGYTVPYLRVMKVLLASYDKMHMGWGACGEAETSCEVGPDVSMSPGDCKTLTHPSKPSMKYDVCYDGPGVY